MKKISHFLKTTEGKFLGSLTIIIVLLFAYYFYATSENRVSVNNEKFDIAISKNDHIRGKKDAILTLIEFGDFQCPACGAYKPIVTQVLEDNKDVLKLSFKHFPLIQIHKNALLAAKASEAASNQGKFWEMHDILYEKQEEWSGSLNALDFFKTYATTLRLDVNKFISDMENKEIEDKILAEYKEGVRLKVQGTPTFFLNGKKLEGIRDLASFNKAIKEEVETLSK